MIYTLNSFFILLRLWLIVLSQPDEFRLNDFTPDPVRWMHGALIANKKIAISNNITFDAVIEVSSHGNGGLTIANLCDVKVYDEHDDGDLYRNTLLHIKFADINGDGFRDLIIYGMVDFYSDDDKIRNKPLTSRPVVHLYRFNPEKRIYESIFHYAPTWSDLYGTKN